MHKGKKKIAIIGVGYVGLPLAIEFGKKFETIAYDKNLNKIRNLKKNIDINNEHSKIEIKKAKKLFFSNNLNDIKFCNVFIFTLPTPIFKNKLPDLSILKKSLIDIGNFLKKNDLVVFESTVYPGATEEVFVPILEKISKLKLNKDFYCGYSPERINPGDKKKKIKDIIKITSGSNLKSLKKVDDLYRSIIKAGTFKAKSIKIAEASKVIENTQRDINIALVNELSQIFNKLKIDTQSVLEAARTKWNFLDFKPGLVGGHCIGVDPYYLTYKAKQKGHNPKVILSGRSINENLDNYIFKKIDNILNNKKLIYSKLNVLFMGLAFKENCSDTRNSKVFKIIDKYINKKSKINLYDPNIAKFSLDKKYQKFYIKDLKKNTYNLIIISIKHDQFKKIKFSQIKNYCKKNYVIIDLKSIFPSKNVDFQL